MRTRIVAASIVAAGLVFAGGVASADPGPNGHNNKGLCNAFHSGSDTGRANKSSAPPFVALQHDMSSGMNVAPDCPGSIILPE